MNAEFNWWLLIVGLVIGAGLVWLILADSTRREADVTERERAGEARWIADALRGQGRPISPDDVRDVLDLHRSYLAAPPPDEAFDEIEPVDQPEPIDAEPPVSGPSSRPPRGAMAHPAAERGPDGDRQPV